VAYYLNNEKNIMRFSFGAYNSKDDIDILISSINTYL
jgi:selenocysteine lyase/cysteine desulfurase